MARITRQSLRRLRRVFRGTPTRRPETATGGRFVEARERTRGRLGTWL